MSVLPEPGGETRDAIVKHPTHFRTEDGQAVEHAGNEGQGEGESDFLDGVVGSLEEQEEV